MNFLIEGYDVDAVESLDMDEVEERLSEVGDEYGFEAEGRRPLALPEKNFMLANITHMETQETPLGYAEMVWEGRRRADAIVEFLQDEFPDIFADARVRKYGNPGLRQSRWIVGRDQIDPSRIFGRGTTGRRSGTERLVGRTARLAGRRSLGTLRLRPSLLYSAFLYGASRGRQPRRRRTLRGRRHACPLRNSRDRSVHGDGCGRCTCTGTRGHDPVHEVDMDELQDALHDNLERTDS